MAKHNIMSDIDRIEVDIELKPCPFCGGEAELRYENRLGRTIRCRSCHIGITNKVLRQSTEWLEQKLIEKWNKRVANCI